MISFDNMVVTSIQPPVVVHSKKGRFYQMKNRQTFGLSFCMSGQITYTMNGKKYISEQGNAVILPQGMSYLLLGDKEGFFPLINFQCANFHCDEITVLPLENPQACIQKFKMIQELFLYNKSMLKIHSAFYDLLDNVICLQEKKEDTLGIAMKYIEENIQDPGLSNTVLAKHVGISEVYLRKQFLSRYQSTPKQYILDIRICKAQQLLIGTPLTVAVVAEECGFSSVYHFCRTFKQRTGLTPTQYAEKNREIRI